MGTGSHSCGCQSLGLPWRLMLLKEAMAARMSWEFCLIAKAQLLHLFPVILGRFDVGVEDVVGKREDDVEILVGVFMVQPVVSSQELVDRPVAETTLLGFVHLEMNLVPDPVV